MLRITRGCSEIVKESFEKDLGLRARDGLKPCGAVRKLPSPLGRRVGDEGLCVLDEIYTGTKADLRPIYDRLMDAIYQFGEFEIAPKKGYISLRRKKQFAMIGPATNTRIEVGINIKSLAVHPRLVEMPAGSMCNFKVKVTQVSEVDDELIAWVRQAYESAG